MASKPLVTFIVLTYNQEKFVRDAVRSVMSQNYSPLEIIISDDCSADKTFEIVEAEVAVYSGPHKIILNRNKKNIGIASNLNRVWELSSGSIFIAGAGDDINLPDRTKILVERLIGAEPSVDLAVSYFSEIDEFGKETGFVDKEVAFTPDTTKDVLKWRCGATGACVGYNRRLYEKYGPLDSRVHAEDWVISYWAWLERGIAVIEEPLVLRRTHDNSMTGKQRTLKKIQDMKQRRLRRQQTTVSRLAIAEEWLRAWQIGGDQRETRIEKELQRLVRVRTLFMDSFHSSRTKALTLAFKLIRDGGIINASKAMVRHFLRWD